MREGEIFISLVGEIDQKFFFLNKDFICMVFGFFDLNCSNLVCVKLFFLGREDYSKKRGKKNDERKRKEYILQVKEQVV